MDSDEARPGMEADGLFVYGTLRKGGSRHAWLTRTLPVGSTRAFSPGRLFHLPEVSLPAMVPGPIPKALPPGSGWVTGDFVGYEDDSELESALNDLDQIEGVAEGRIERKMVPVLLEGGQAYTAWAYVLPMERVPRLEREASELLEGDWSPYLSPGQATHASLPARFARYVPPPLGRGTRP